MLVLNAFDYTAVIHIKQIEKIAFGRQKNYIIESRADVSYAWTAHFFFKKSFSRFVPKIFEESFESSDSQDFQIFVILKVSSRLGPVPKKIVVFEISGG